MRDLLDSLALLVMVTICMLICAVAVPIALVVGAVWAPAEGVVNLCRNVCRLRDGK
jgi:hypothetical protein